MKYFTKAPLTSGAYYHITLQKNEPLSRLLKKNRIHIQNILRKILFKVHQLDDGMSVPENKSQYQSNSPRSYFSAKSCQNSIKPPSNKKGSGKPNR